jgi:hypothetical protein
LTESDKIKIVVTGGDGVGKTTFIKTLSDPWTDDPAAPSPIQDFGRIAIDDLIDRPLTIYLFSSLHGQRTALMDSIRDELLCVILVNSTDPSMFSEARATIEVVENYSDFTYIIAASFQDRPDAWDIADLRHALQIPPHVQIVPCDVRVKTDALRVLRALLEVALGV